MAACAFARICSEAPSEEDSHGPRIDRATRKSGCPEKKHQLCENSCRAFVVTDKPIQPREAASEPRRDKADLDRCRKLSPTQPSEQRVAFGRLPSLVRLKRPSHVKYTAVGSITASIDRNDEGLETLSVIGVTDDGGFGIGWQ